MPITTESLNRTDEILINAISNIDEEVDNSRATLEIANQTNLNKAIKIFEKGCKYTVPYFTKTTHRDEQNNFLNIAYSEGKKTEQGDIIYTPIITIKKSNNKITIYGEGIHIRSFQDTLNLTNVTC